MHDKEQHFPELMDSVLKSGICVDNLEEILKGMKEIASARKKFYDCLAKRYCKKKAISQ